MRLLWVALIPAFLACSTSRHALAPPRLPFVENDYPQALKRARAQGLPLFVDTWAPWCHSCRSMRAYIFPDPAITRHAERYVWLELNTDLPQNAAFLEKYPVENWPTLFVVDPREERVLVRFAGTATVPQLEQLFDDGVRAYRKDAQGAELSLAQGDARYGEGKPAEAAKAYAQALNQAPLTWPRRTRTLESWVTALKGAGEAEGCAEQGLAELKRLPPTAPWGNAATVALYCALELPDTHPRAQVLRSELVRWARQALDTPEMGLAVDDRSCLYEVLVEERKEAGDSAGTHALAEAWLTLLEGAAAKAATPEARSVFDWHRMVAALELKMPERVVGALEQSQRDLPGDYNPPARLATLYRLQGRLDEALQASDRALSKVQGGRKIRVLSERADIFLARGQLPLALQTLREAQAEAARLSPTQVSARQRQALSRQLASLEQAN